MYLQWTGNSVFEAQLLLIAATQFFLCFIYDFVYPLPQHDVTCFYRNKTETFNYKSAVPCPSCVSCCGYTLNLEQKIFLGKLNPFSESLNAIISLPVET